MANVYVYSGAAGAGTGADWANAYTTLAAALTAKAAGDDFWVADDHAESQATAMTQTSPGTAASPCRIICVRRSGGSVPPVSADLRTTATITTTGNSNLTLGAGFAYAYGITFNCGTGNNAALLILASNATEWWRLEACALKIVATSSSSQIIVGQLGGSILQSRHELYNTTLSFGAAGQVLNVRGGEFVWEATASAIAGTAPTTLFTCNASTGGVPTARIIGVDLSAVGSSHNLVNIGITGASYNFYFQDCQLGASVAITTGSVSGPGGGKVELVNCDSGNTNYRYYKQDYQGTITQETVIVRSGGATDGTTPVSRKMVSTANSKFYSPLKSGWMSVWIDTTGSSKTITICTVTDNVTLKDNECWIEIEYLGTSSLPLGNFVNDAAADALNAGTNQTTDTSTWTTTGLGTPVKQQLSASFTPQVKGLARARVCLAKASTTVYVDPLPVVT